MLAGESLWPAFAVGVVLNVPGVWYLAALKDILTGKYSTATDVLLIVGFNLIMFTLIEVPLISYLLAPERSATAVARFNDWLHDHSRQIGIALGTAIGIYLLVKGISEAV